jgi:hypothetical protein
MRIITAGVLLSLPRLTGNTVEHRPNLPLILNSIKKETKYIPESTNYSRRYPSQLAGMLKAGEVLIAKLDRSLTIGPPCVGAINFRKSKSPLEPLSYNKGDDAESIDDFAKAVHHEYVVYSNKNAHNKKIFKSKIIMIYGESHAFPRLPSIRNGRGALLLENPDMDQCLEKHKLYAGNVCKHIDIVDTSMLHVSGNKLYLSFRELVRQLDPKEYKRLDNKRKEPNVPSTLILQETMDFVNKNFKRIYALKDENTRKKLADSYTLADLNYKEDNELKWATLQKRDAGMALEAKKIIDVQKDGEATTIIVGNAHVKGLFNALEKEFPQHAIVGCFTNDITAAGRNNKEHIKGINAKQVNISPDKNKSEL